MTIKNRLILSTSLVFIFLLIISTTLLLGYRYVSGKASIANQFDRESMYLQMMLRGVNEVIITEGTPQSVEIAEEGLRGFDEIHTQLLSEIEEPDTHRVLSEGIDPRWQNIKVMIKPFLEHHLDVEAVGLMITYGKVIAEVDEVIKSVNTLSEQTRAVVNNSSSISSIVQKLILSSVSVILIVFAYLSYRTYGSILSPVRDLSSIAEGFHRGDLSIHMTESSTGEFGLLASHFNKAISKLNTMILNVKSSTDTLALNSLNLSASISQIAGNTREQSLQTTQAAAATEELNSSFTDVARNSSTAAESAKSATELAISGGEVVNKTIKEMDMIALTVRESALSIETLGRHSEKIGEIVQVINDIAGQTNLLALNAAIEAARAGEQGRGFAVVADEVRKLAEKTTSATSEITDMINNIQDSTDRAVNSMKKGTEKVMKGVESANLAGDSLMQIVSSVQNVSDMIQHIATAAEEQTTTGRDIASSIESVANITGQTADGAQDSSEATNNLNGLAQELKQIVSGFKLHDRIKGKRIQNSDSSRGSACQS